MKNIVIELKVKGFAKEHIFITHNSMVDGQRKVGGGAVEASKGVVVTSVIVLTIQ